MCMALGVNSLSPALCDPHSCTQQCNAQLILHLILNFSCAQSPAGSCNPNLVMPPSLSCTAKSLPSPLFPDTLSGCKPCAMTMLSWHCPGRWLQPACWGEGSVEVCVQRL